MICAMCVDLREAVKGGGLSEIECGLISHKWLNPSFQRKRPGSIPDLAESWHCNVHSLFDIYHLSNF